MEIVLEVKHYQTGAITATNFESLKTETTRKSKINYFATFLHLISWGHFGLFDL